MRNIIALALLLVFVMPVVSLPVFAAEEAAQTGIVDAGNKLCPISGEPVSGKDFATYNGKRYGFCCPGCDKMFLADPEKAIAKMNAQEAALAPAEEAGHSHHEM